jgi:predicted nucleic acid-binding protein
MGKIGVNMLVYLDNCCLNRQNDDQTQDIIRVETNVIAVILSKCFYGSWELVGSDVVEYEIMKTPNLDKRNRALDLYKIKKRNITLNDTIIKRANEIQKHGIMPIDSLHFASAEYGNVDVLLSVDKDFLKKSRNVVSSLKVENPVIWFMMEVKND